MAKISVENDKMFKVSLPGYDVDTATPEQCAVHSGFDYPKIEEHLEGYEAVTLPNSISAGTTDIKVITHNYGYIPNAFVFMKVLSPDVILYNTEFAMLPYFLFDPPLLYYTYEITTTQLKIQIVYDDIFGPGPLTVGEGSPAGTQVGFKWQVWVND